MCGIAGAISTARSAEQLASLVDTIVTKQVPRGPDHQAVVSLPEMRVPLVLGHDRLKVIELSDASNQPMWDVDHRLCIVFNGEIYNYLELRSELSSAGSRFRTGSDTEVILEAFKTWDTMAFGRMLGMFAFCIVDARRQRIHLVRDRFGVKPLHYVANGEVLVFASSARALARHFGLRPDLEYVSRGMSYYVYEDGSDRTPYEGLKSVPAGQYATVDLPCIRPTMAPYYDLARGVEGLRVEMGTCSEQDWVERLREVLGSAVSLRLRSDVPVAVSLSGGLDSATVAAIAAGEHDHLAGFCYGHPAARVSEGPLAEELSNKVGLRTHYVWPALDKGLLVRSFERTLDAQEAPFPLLSVMAQNMVYEASRDSGYRVLLGGQGADEAFMGYRKYFLFQIRHLAKAWRVRDTLAFGLSCARTVAAERRSWSLYARQRDRYREMRSSSHLTLPAVSLRLMPDASADPNVRQMEDVTSLSLPTLLRYEDRNSMAYGVESRLPFLDHRVIELGLAMPSPLKVKDGYAKWPIRQASRDLIPESIRAARYKRGFDVCQGWLENGLGEYLHERIMDCLPQVRQFVQDPAAAFATFSVDAIIRRPSVLAEAITLIWLSSCD